MKAFVFLEGDQNRLDSSGKLKRNLYKWESDTLKTLDPIDRITREQFLEKAKVMEQSKFETLLRMLTLMSKMKDTTLKKVESLLEDLT